MATPVTISTAVINYTSGTTDCQCSIETQVLSIGTTYVGTSVSLLSADLAPDWTDDQLCEAVALKLGVPASDVSVAEPPAPDFMIPRVGIDAGLGVQSDPSPVVPEPDPIDG
jgi:hypothetical protein